MQAVRDDSAAAGSGIPNAEALLTWTDAAIAHDEVATTHARARVVEAAGADAAVDAAAIIGNFERMTRIADATGIPLDPPVNALGAELQRDLGLRNFGSAANTAEPSAWVSATAKVLAPVALRLMPLAAKLARWRT